MTNQVHPKGQIPKLLERLSDARQAISKFDFEFEQFRNVLISEIDARTERLERLTFKTQKWTRQDEDQVKDALDYLAGALDVFLD